MSHSILVLAQTPTGELADDGFVLLSLQGTCQRDLKTQDIPVGQYPYETYNQR